MSRENWEMDLTTETRRGTLSADSARNDGLTGSVFAGSAGWATGRGVDVDRSLIHYIP
jgi:hypothetical protein